MALAPCELKAQGGPEQGGEGPNHKALLRGAGRNEHRVVNKAREARLSAQEHGLRSPHEARGHSAPHEGSSDDPEKDA